MGGGVLIVIVQVYDLLRLILPIPTEVLFLWELRAGELGIRSMGVDLQEHEAEQRVDSGVKWKNLHKHAARVSSFSLPCNIPSQDCLVIAHSL